MVSIVGLVGIEGLVGFVGLVGLVGLKNNVDLSPMVSGVNEVDERDGGEQTPSELYGRITRARWYPETTKSS